MFAVTPAAAAVATAAISFIVGAVTQAARDEGAAEGARLGDCCGAKAIATAGAAASTRGDAALSAPDYGGHSPPISWTTHSRKPWSMSCWSSFCWGRMPSAGTSSSSSLLAANPPTILGNCAWTRKFAALDEALCKSASRQRFQIEQQWAVRVSDLQGLLLRHRPDIVHFSGHGSPASGLFLEDGNGLSRHVPAAALADLFGILNDTVRCVVLNACYSHEQAAAIGQHIAAVIGMNGKIGDEASVVFAAAFYQALGYGKDVPTAFSLGVSQLGLYDLPDATLPQLLVK